MTFSHFRTAVPALVCLLMAACGDDAEGPGLPPPAHGLPNDAIVSELSEEDRTRLCEDSARRMDAVTESLEGSCTLWAKQTATSGETCEKLRKDCIAEGKVKQHNPSPDSRCKEPDVDGEYPGATCSATVAEYADCVAVVAGNWGYFVSACKLDPEKLAAQQFACSKRGCAYFPQ